MANLGLGLFLVALVGGAAWPDGFFGWVVLGVIGLLFLVGAAMVAGDDKVQFEPTQQDF